MVQSFQYSNDIEPIKKTLSSIAWSKMEPKVILNGRKRFNLILDNYHGDETIDIYLRKAMNAKSFPQMMKCCLKPGAILSLTDISGNCIAFISASSRGEDTTINLVCYESGDIDVYRV
jgi:hypothetical protein